MRPLPIEVAHGPPFGSIVFGGREQRRRDHIGPRQAIGTNELSAFSAAVARSPGNELPHIPSSFKSVSMLLDGSVARIMGRAFICLLARL
jgi:hypothetical protein